MNAASEYFLYVSLHYTSCSISLREQLARVAATCNPSLFLSRALGCEIVVISTCNRFDVCAFGEVTFGAVLRALQSLGSAQGAPFGLGPEVCRVRCDDGAAELLFQVACSLDSLVLGEAQILGQIKESYAQAREAGACGPGASLVFSACFRAAKRVRSQTLLGSRGVSLGSSCVEVARRFFDDLTRLPVLLLGAGTMARLCAQHLLAHGTRRLAIASRSVEGAQRLQAALGDRVEVLPLGRALGDLLSEFSLVVAATSSPVHLLGAGEVAPSSAPRVFLDLGVPRNLDPRIRDVSGAFLFDVDDLESNLQSGQEARKQAAGEARMVIGEAVAEFRAARQQNLGLQGVARFHAWCAQTVRSELQRARASLPPAEIERRVAAAVAKRLVSRVALLTRRGDALPNLHDVSQALDFLFGLPEQLVVAPDEPQLQDAL